VAVARAMPRKRKVTHDMEELDNGKISRRILKKISNNGNDNIKNIVSNKNYSLYLKSRPLNFN
jgi:hypothetical protein